LVHIVTAVFVFPISLLIFDLDLSDFPLKQVPSKRVVVVTDLPKDEELANLLNDDDLRMKPSLLDPSIFKESISPQHKEKLIASRFRVDRIYVLRLTLRRSSTLDSSPGCLTLHPFQFIPPPKGF